MSRFTQLEQTFDLPSLENSVENNDTMEESLAKAKQLANEHKDQDYFELHDNEMDEIADLAVEYAKDLHDLGLNVDVKNAGEIFTASASMFKIAVDARHLKMDKRLKLMKLELDRIKMDRTTPEKSEIVEASDVKIIDRSELLAQLKEIQEKDELPKS